MRKLSTLAGRGRHLSPTFPQNLGTRNPGNLGRKPNLLVTSLLLSYHRLEIDGCFPHFV